MSNFKVSLISRDDSTRDDPIPQWVLDTFQKEGINFVSKECTTRDEMASLAGDADVVWVFGDHQDVMTSENLDVLPQCGAIIRTGSGCDNIPVDAATKLGIIVANTPTAVSGPVSEHTIGLLFAVIRHIPFLDRGIRAGKWQQVEIGRKRGWHLQGKTLGLIGFGNIPRLVVKKLSGFDLTVLVCDPYVEKDVIVSAGAESETMENVLSKSDFVSVHCPYTQDTYHLIDERALRLMQPHAIFINTSRGPVVDEPVLVRALTEKWIAAAGIDVFEQEPPDPENPLFKLDNVVVTPHTAGYADTTTPDFWRLSVETAVDLSHGSWPRSYVNPGVKPRWNLK